MKIKSLFTLQKLQENDILMLLMANISRVLHILCPDIIDIKVMYSFMYIIHLYIQYSELCVYLKTFLLSLQQK